MEFGGWSSWQVITLVICIGTAIGCASVTRKEK